MESIYLVSYQLFETNKDYSELTQELKMSRTWCHPLRTTWLIQTEETLDQLYKRLEPFIYDKDRILITPLSDNLRGRLTDEAWEWIKEVKHV